MINIKMLPTQLKMKYYYPRWWCGKYYMIKKLNEKNKIINTASTGTAAININGVTIHNLLRIFQNKKVIKV